MQALQERTQEQQAAAARRAMMFALKDDVEAAISLLKIEVDIRIEGLRGSTPELRIGRQGPGLDIPELSIVLTRLPVSSPDGPVEVEHFELCGWKYDQGSSEHPGGWYDESLGLYLSTCETALNTAAALFKDRYYQWYERKQQGNVQE